MSTETVTESRPKCDQCGKLGSFGRMMPWPHSGWVCVQVGAERLDFCCNVHARGWLLTHDKEAEQTGT